MTARSSTVALPRIAISLKFAVSLFVASALALIGLVIVYQSTYAERIYPGVTALRVDLGGKTESEARSLLADEFDLYAKSPLVLRSGEQTWSITPAALGVSLDVDPLASAAARVGHEGSIGQKLAAQLNALIAGERVPGRLSLDQDKVAAKLASIDEELSEAPANAGLEIKPDGQVAVTPSSAGLSLDVDRTIELVLARAGELSSEDIPLTVKSVPGKIGDAAIEKARAQANNLLDEPLTLTISGKSWTLTTSDLARMTSVTYHADAVDVRLDEGKVTSYLQTIAASIAKTPIDARIRIVGGKAEVTPGSSGEALDIVASRSAVMASIGKVASIPLVVKQTNVVSVDDLAAVKKNVETILGGPTTFRYGARSFALPESQVAAMLSLSQPEAGEVPQIQLDATKLASFVQGIAKQIDVKPKNAVLRVEGGKVVVVSSEVAGLTVDVDSTVAAARRALATNPGSPIPLDVKVANPTVSSAMIPSIVLSETIMDSRTSYAGASAPKVHNVQLAASRLNGTLIAPGATFSFNDALGQATTKTGFKVGWGIRVNSQGNAVTIPAEAGGICQVATTLFHSAFWAGYPIVERHHHSYWIARYGTPPRGMKGLDATVDDQTGVDFRFRNNTANWISVESSAKSGVLRFVLHGVKPDWQVTVSDPQITKVVETVRQVFIREDSTLPLGQKLMVETAQDGFDAAITRTVSRGDSILETYTIKSHYLPSRNVQLIGTKASPTPTTKKATPSATPGKATPTKTPVPTRTPTRTPAR